MWILPGASLLNWIRLNHSFQNINNLDHNVQVKILSRNLSFAVDLDKQSNVQMKILSRSLSFAVDLDKQNFCIKVDQMKLKFVKYQSSLIS